MGVNLNELFRGDLELRDEDIDRQIFQLKGNFTLKAVPIDGLLITDISPR